MEYSLLHRTSAITLAILLFFGMLVFVMLGRLASRAWDKQGDIREPKGGVGSLLAAMFTLSGFILAFAFGMSGSRLERVRVVVETEANQIGTAVLRADLYQDSARRALRRDFKDYIEAIIEFYDKATTPDGLKKAKDDAAKASASLWAIVTSQSKQPNMLIPSNSMIASMNGMFDIAQQREIVLNERVPDLIIYMLFICIFASCFIGGFTSGPFHYREWVIIVGFTLISSMVVYTTIDLGRPMRGLIKERAARQAIVELRDMFSPNE